MAEAQALGLYAALLRGELEGDEALRASRHIFDLVMGNVEQAIWWKDRDSVYLGANRKLAEYAGVEDPSEMIGRTDADFPWADCSDGPGGSDWFISIDHWVVQHAKPMLGMRERVRRADGTLMWVETNKIPVIDSDGTVIATLGSFIDITQRIEAEQRLKETLAELDDRVRRRTAELREANVALRREVQERVRLEQQERDRRSRAETLRDTAASLARSLHVDDVVEDVLTGVASLIEDHDSFVALYGPDGRLEVVGERVMHPRGQSVPDPSDIVEHLEQAASNPSTNIGVHDTTTWFRLESGNRRLGVLAITNRHDVGVTDEELSLLATLADQASSAISNSRALVMASSLAAIEERQRLAKDLHDSVSQSLWTASLVAETLTRSGSLAEEDQRNVERLQRLTMGSLSEMRTLLLELRPSVIEATPFAELISQLARGLEGRQNAKCDVRLHNMDGLDPRTKVALYRISQECLNNIARHADASSVEIEARRRGETIELVVSDDGAGFDTGANHEHMGLRIMAERAAELGGELTVQSKVGIGTSIVLRVPGGVTQPAAVNGHGAPGEQPMELGEIGDLRTGSGPRP